MFLEMFPQYIVNVIAHRQLPFTGNADDDRYFPVQFLVYIDTLPAFAFVRGEESPHKFGLCGFQRFGCGLFRHLFRFRFRLCLFSRFPVRFLFGGNGRCYLFRRATRHQAAQVGFIHRILSTRFPCHDYTILIVRMISSISASKPHSFVKPASGANRVLR